MRILYLNYLYDIGGISLGSALKIRRLAEGLERLGHEVEIRWLHPQASIERSSPAAPAGRRPWRTPFRQLIQVPRTLIQDAMSGRTVQRILVDSRPDVVIARTDLCRVTAVRLAKRRGLPVVLDADAPVVLETEIYDALRFGAGLARSCERWVLRSADAIFAQSRVTRQLLIEEGAPFEKIAIIPNGAALEEMAGPEERRRIRRRCGLAEEATVVGFVGSFNVFHGIQDLLRVIPQTSGRDSEVRYLLVGGGGGLEEMAREFAEENEAVVRTGIVAPSDVPSFLAAMDIGVAPYAPHDNFYFSPIKIFEYMASGLLVVAPSLGQISELIQHDDTGLLYDPAESGGLERCIRHALSLSAEERRRIGGNARRAIEERFTWHHAAERLEALIVAAVERQAERGAGG
jgi:glycosyltransferase involved in cell wall biosynthesis